jgi:hypothetical protein
MSPDMITWYVCHLLGYDEVGLAVGKSIIKVQIRLRVPHATYLDKRSRLGIGKEEEKSKYDYVVRMSHTKICRSRLGSGKERKKSPDMITCSVCHLIGYDEEGLAVEESIRKVRI